MTQHQVRSLTEDDIYRTSSQYRIWSFSPESLAALRKKTHDLAIERARLYHGSKDGQNGDGSAALPKDLLTEEEELRLVQRYCHVLRTTSDFFKWDNKVKATAVQFLKRFYLSNSCLTYPPLDIYKTVLYIASKAETTHTNVHEFGRRIATDPEIVLAPEYKVMQSLRFTLDVRQPWRGLKGMLMELLNIAEGEQDMLALEPPPAGSKTLWTVPSRVREQHLADRVNAAYSAAKLLLDAPALLTDAYLLYTPSQIAFASLLLADPPLTHFYLSTKLPDSSTIKMKIMATLRACSEMLASFDPESIMSKEERSATEKKLEACRDPTTRDLVARNRELKRGTDEANEEKVKKRRLERERSQREGEDLFGPTIQNPI
ncbi:hypothetical protein K431DRAFT_279904 [Polychaeton citri CBS 116435]|uniref:Cyclin C-terminal domain-containing protein n=1 Tax=Polychaeton citri CBS 116435 TaxID=1314669 RepID=A0A9P4PXP1_9PEZI|nr:hypothetical protein K431DRAFT_279904 [Polychaeton citri CBS 116435]